MAITLAEMMKAAQFAVPKIAPEEAKATRQRRGYRGGRAR